MQSNACLLLITAMLAGAHPRPVAAQQSDRVYVVTYIEAVPSAAAQVLELLTAYAEKSRRAEGNLQFQPLRRIGRPNHFAILEAWTDAAALESHSRSPDAERFSASLAPLLDSPPDRRTQQDLLTGAPGGTGAQSASGAPGRGAVYVLTHVDVLPSSLEQALGYLRTLAEAGRAKPANLRFDVLVTQRRNHMTIVEVWADTDAQEAHLADSDYRAFRKDLAPMLGALYDERLYRGL
jgi:quinol monooxygenase YgiN